MAGISNYTVADLALVTGRPEASFTPYAEEALVQAKLIFKLATCLEEQPTDEDKSNLVRYGIVSMADNLVIQQTYTLVKGNPFSSESIGSYSYTKATEQVRKGEKTGVYWFDLAVEQLGVCETGSGVYTGSTQVFELGLDVETDGTERELQGPSQKDQLALPFDVNSDFTIREQP